MSKPRTGIPGTGLGKVVNESAWGKQTATKRYEYGTQHPDMGPVPSNKPQKLGDANNQQGNYYDNDCRPSWKTGAGETSENKPGYVPGFRAPTGRESYRADSVEDQSGPPLRTGRSLHPYGTDGGQQHGQGDSSPFSTAYHQQQGRKGR